MIDVNEINQILADCFFTEQELAAKTPTESECVSVAGVVNHFGFHPARLQTHLPRLKEIVQELHPNFVQGWTFLNLPFDKHGQQWGEHRDAEALLCLCIGNNLASFLMPRELWETLPGGAPYVIFNEHTNQEGAE